MKIGQIGTLELHDDGETDSAGIPLLRVYCPICKNTEKNHKDAVELFWRTMKLLHPNGEHNGCRALHVA